MAQFHAENHALATLAVQERQTSRYLLFDEQLQLCGRKSGARWRSRTGSHAHRTPRRWLSPASTSSLRASFSLMTEEGVFSIIAPYLRLAAQGEKIIAFRSDEYQWRDLGRLDDVTQADQEAKQLSAQAKVDSTGAHLSRRDGESRAYFFMNAGASIESCGALSRAPRQVNTKAGGRLRQIIVRCTERK